MFMNTDQQEANETKPAAPQPDVGVEDQGMPYNRIKGEANAAVTSAFQRLAAAYPHRSDALRLRCFAQRL